LERARPEGPSREEIEAVLAGVPDLRKALEKADSEEMTELLEAFDVEVNYDKAAERLEMSAALAPEAATALDDKRPPQGRSQDSSIAGERPGLRRAPPVPLESVVKTTAEAKKPHRR